MPDPEEPGVTPEPNDRRPAPARQTQAPPPPPEDDAEDRERLKRALDAERETKRKLEKQMKDLERRVREIDEAEEQKKAGDLSEVERLRKTASEQAQKLREAEQQAAQTKAALDAQRLDISIERQAAGTHQYPELAPALVRRQIPIDPETGEADPKDIKDALDRFAKKYPGMLTSHSGGGTPPREGPRRQAGGPAPQYASRGQHANVGDDLEGFIGAYH